MKDNIKVIVPDCLYFGGDVVHGVVELTVVKERGIKSKGVHLLFAAFEQSKWSEANGNSSQSRSQRRIFLAHRIDFTGEKREARKDAVIDKVGAGLYRWPFAIALPYLIPPSCRLIHGKIEYNLSAYINVTKALMSFDLKHSLRLNVGGNLYNQVEYCRSIPPVMRNKDKRFVFTSGKLSMEATIPKRNLFVGEILQIQIAVTNASKKPVEAIKVDTLGQQCCMAYGSRKLKTTRENKRKYDIQFSGKSQDLKTIEYTINSDIPTFGATEQVSLVHPKTVELQHYIRIRLIVPWAANVQITFPINIMRVNPRAPMVTSNGMPLSLSYHTPPPLPALQTSPSQAFPDYLEDPYPITSHVSSVPSLAPSNSSSSSSISFSPPNSPPFPNTSPFPHITYAPTAPSLAPTNSSSSISFSPPPSPLIASPPSHTPPAADWWTSPNYPVLQDYQYPRDTTAIPVFIGDHQVNEEEANFLNQ